MGRGLLRLLLGRAENARHGGDESWKTETESERRDRFHTVRLDNDLASVKEVDDSVEVVLGVVREHQLNPCAADQALAESAKVWRGCSENG